MIIIQYPVCSGLEDVPVDGLKAFSVNNAASLGIFLQTSFGYLFFNLYIWDPKIVAFYMFTEEFCSISEAFSSTLNLEL